MRSEKTRRKEVREIDEWGLILEQSCHIDLRVCLYSGNFSLRGISGIDLDLLRFIARERRLFIVSRSSIARFFSSMMILSPKSEKNRRKISLSIARCETPTSWETRLVTFSSRRKRESRVPYAKQRWRWRCYTGGEGGRNDNVVAQ